MRDDHDDHDDHDDGTLAGIDLEAWQPPAPPPGLADAVIARLGEPPAAPALEAQPPRRARRTRIAQVAGALAIATAGAGLALWGTARAPRDGHGARIATGAEHLALDATAADLDPGAELRWARDGHRIAAQQARGAVHWTVAGDDTLVLEPGGTGSAVSIEASGASLRVEVSMNLSDARVLGVTTAAAVLTSVITVAVYQGHIKATSGGQTIQVEPGATVELRPGSPPRPPELRPDHPPIAVGAAPDQALHDQLAAAEKRIAELTAELAARDTGPVADAITVSPSALDAYRVSGKTNLLPDDATRQQIAGSAIVRNDTHIVGSFRVCVDDHGEVARAQVVKSTRFEAYDRTIIRGIRAWRFRPFLFDRKPTPACAVFSFVYSTDEPKPPPGPPPAYCNSMAVHDLVEQATKQYNAGYSKPAFLLMMKMLACEQNPQLIRQAGLYACGARDGKAASELLAKLSGRDREPVLLRCQLEGIALEPPR